MPKHPAAATEFSADPPFFLSVGLVGKAGQGKAVDVDVAVHVIIFITSTITANISITTPINTQNYNKLTTTAQLISVADFLEIEASFIQLQQIFTH